MKSKRLFGLIKKFFLIRNRILLRDFFAVRQETVYLDGGSAGAIGSKLRSQTISRYQDQGRQSHPKLIYFKFHILGHKYVARKFD